MSLQSSMMNLLVSVLYLFSMVTLVSYQIITSVTNSFIPRRFKRKKNIRGQRVLITGAGSGIGRELAIQFSKYSTCLILVDINRQSLLQTEKMLDRRSAVFIYDCDISDYEKVYKMAKKVHEEAGDVDILVNNAGIVSGNYHLSDLPEEKIIKTMQVNALAHFWTCKAFLPPMMEKNYGHIVSIVSIAGKIGGPRVVDYCTSKFAAFGFAESLEIELRSKKLDGIKVTIVCPSIINTGLFEGASLSIGGVMSPAYVAHEVIAAVLEEQEILFLPKYFKYLIHIHENLPRWLRIRIHELSGNIKVMDNFVGRKTQSENVLDVNTMPSKTG